MELFRKYTVPIVMACVAANQFVLVQKQGLCSWRGGGFGMYASFHPRHHDAWVTRTDTGEKTRYQKYDESSSKVYSLIRPCLTWPTDTQLERALAKLPPSKRSIHEFRIYRLDYDLENSVLTRKLLAEALPHAEP